MRITQARCDKCGTIHVIPDHEVLSVKFETSPVYGGVVEWSGSKDLCTECFSDFLKVVAPYVGNYPRKHR